MYLFPNVECRVFSPHLFLETVFFMCCFETEPNVAPHRDVFLLLILFLCTCVLWSSKAEGNAIFSRGERRNHWSSHFSVFHKKPKLLCVPLGAEAQKKNIQDFLQRVFFVAKDKVFPIFLFSFSLCKKKQVRFKKRRKDKSAVVEQFI